MKKTEIEIPAGCEVEKTEVVDGALVVTFKPKEPRLPMDWEDFCEKFPIRVGECFFSELSVIKEAAPIWRNSEQDKNLLPDLETAEAVLALCQLIQLRECFNQGWKPDWKNYDERKYTIEFHLGEIIKDWYSVRCSTPLFFKTEELRDLFLEEFRDLVEKLKPLHGIAL